MNSPLVLISLPAELIARVADDSALSKHDLMRLRLTCRLLNFWATYSLAQQHLSKIGISLTRYDLQALSAISKHPQFGPHIRSIQLDHTRVHPDQVAILADAMVQAKQSGNDGYPKAKERFQGTSRRFVDELELEDSEEALQSLIVAFSALKTYDNPITLTSADTHLMGCDFGHTRITEFFGPYVYDEPKHTHLNSTIRVSSQQSRDPPTTKIPGSSHSCQNLRAQFTCGTWPRHRLYQGNTVLPGDPTIYCIWITDLC